MSVKNKATVNAPWVCYTHTSNTIQPLVYPYSMVFIGIEGVQYISAWGFGVARFDRQGNSYEPQGVERATVQGFTLFLCLEVQLFLINLRVAEVLNPTKL